MTTRHTYRIRGMDCAEEVESLKATVGKLAGVTDLTFNLLNGSMTLTLSADGTEEQVREAVRRSGLRAEPWDSGNQATSGKEPFWERRGRLLTCLGSAFSLGIAIHLCGWASLLPGVHSCPYPPACMASLLASTILGMWHIVPKAAAAVASLRPDMNLLMTIAILGALALGDWSEAASTAVLFSTSLWLESWSISRSRHALQALTRLSPETARRIRPDDGNIEVLPVERIPVGSSVLVPPGERIPMDGEVVNGEGSVNESPLTGESIPVAKAAGSPVFAGTINNENTLTFRVLKPASETFLARIIRMVEEAENRRAPVEQWIDRFARRYTPIMLALAILIALIPPLILQADWTTWLTRALVTLVIACPCALVLSTPVGIIAGITAAARHGVLIKGGVHLETAARLKALAIDKTGTMTCGEPCVQTVIPLEGRSAQEVLQIAAGLESLATHPLARAIRNAATEKGVAPDPAEEFSILPGKGASGRIQDCSYWIGSHRLLHEKNAETPGIHELLSGLEDAGHSVVILGSGHRVAGILGISDRVRPEAAPMVSALHRAGIRPVIMLTGDNEGTASAIAAQTGVDAYHAELLPDDKLRHMKEFKSRHGLTAMAGDGVNDAPAMAASSLGIAMGAAGSDTAIESADIALMKDDLLKIPWLVTHARRVMNTIRINAAFAIGIKAMILLLSLGGMATLWMAIAADTGATLVVVLWSLRLLKT